MATTYKVNNAYDAAYLTPAQLQDIQDKRDQATAGQISWAAAHEYAESIRAAAGYTTDSQGLNPVLTVGGDLVGQLTKAADNAVKKIETAASSAATKTAEAQKIQVVQNEQPQKSAVSGVGSYNPADYTPQNSGSATADDIGGYIIIGLLGIVLLDRFSRGGKNAKR